MMTPGPLATRHKSCFYSQYLVPALLLLIPAALVVGYWIKGLLG